MTRYVTQTLMVENNTSYVTPTTCQYLADAFRAAFPTGKLTWAIESQAVSAAGMASVRSFVAGQRATYGDGVGLYYSFSALRQTAAAAISEITSLVGTLKSATGETEPTIFAWGIPAAVLPTCISLGVRTVAGQTWGQENIDGYSGEGSPNVPYYPSKTHFLVPAQSAANALDVVMFDTLSSGYWESVNSRITIHTVDAHTLARMQAITRDYLENTTSVPDFKYLNSGCEVRWINDTSQSNPVIYQSGNYYARDRLVSWWQWLASTYPDLQMVNLQTLGSAWRALHPVAQDQQWSATVVSANPSDATRTVVWAFSPQQRSAIAKSDAGAALVDLVNYGDSLTEPAASTTVNYNLEPGQTWSVPAVVSQKRSHVVTAAGGLRTGSRGRRST